MMGVSLVKGKHIAHSAKHAAGDFQVLGASHAKRPAANMRKGVAVKTSVVACMILVVAGCFGIGFASAGNIAGDAANLSMGTNTNVPLTISSAKDSSEEFILEVSASRDLSGAIAQVQQEEEMARIAAEQAAKEAEAAAIRKAQEAQSASSAASSYIGAVDFSVGKDAFIAEWTARIDAYLAGSPLAGYGFAFADAAWQHGVDPRWSPAISNTESTKGANCFAPHNAWGWTGGSWGDWNTAIYAHVAGLSSIYGHTISYANAKKYCPPNYDHWYRATMSEMAKI